MMNKINNFLNNIYYFYKKLDHIKNLTLKPKLSRNFKLLNFILICLNFEII